MADSSLSVCYFLFAFLSLFFRRIFFRFRAKATDFFFSQASRKTLLPTQRLIQRIPVTHFPKKGGLPEKRTTELQLGPRLRVGEATHPLRGKTRTTIFLPSPCSNLYDSTHFPPMCIYFHPTFNFQSPTFCTFLPSSVLRHPPIRFLFPVIYFINPPVPHSVTPFNNLILSSNHRTFFRIIRLSLFLYSF